LAFDHDDINDGKSVVIICHQVLTFPHTWESLCKAQLENAGTLGRPC
jgi:hypothetical protein